MNPRRGSGERSQLGFLGARAGDDEIGRGVALEERDDGVQPLDRLQAGDAQKVWTRMRRRRLVPRDERGVSDEWRKHVHGQRKAKLAMLPATELAERHERVDMTALALEEIRLPPELRWPMVAQRTAHALALGAWLAPMSPEDVRRANQPMLVRGV